MRKGIRISRIAGVFLIGWGLVGTANADLTIENFQAADIVSHPIVILRGKADGREMAIGTSWSNAIRFPVANHRFVAFVELKSGPNMLLLHAGTETMKFRLDYKPMTTSFRVLTTFITAADEKDVYYTTNPRDRFPVQEKLSLAMKLIQAFTADSMIRAGYGDKTFPLEFDPKGQVVVHFVKSPKSGSELRSMDPNAIYSHIYGVAEKAFVGDDLKWCGMLGFTSFDTKTTKATGHLALGGGSQALFGGASMQWWPVTLKDVPIVFSDKTLIDPTKTFEDSAFRHTVWANVSTAFGAMIHELGHTFGLPHSPDRYSVMSRGFDLFSRSFTVQEAPCDTHRDQVNFKQDELARWDPFFAARLNYNPWFQSEGSLGISAEKSARPTLRFEGDDVVIDAPCGIRVIGCQNDGIPSWFTEYRSGEAPKRIKLSRKDLRSKMQDTSLDFQIVVMDSRGQQAEIVDIVGHRRS